MPTCMKISKTKRRKEGKNNNKQEQRQTGQDVNVENTHVTLLSIQSLNRGPGHRLHSLTEALEEDMVYQQQVEDGAFDSA